MKLTINTILLFLCAIFSVSVLAQNESPSVKFENVNEEVLFSKILNEERKLFIYLPDDYSKDKTYPVLYLLDGHRTGRFTEAIKSFKSNQRIGEHIIVGVDNSKNRNRDMIPIKIESRSGSGGSKEFLAFLSKELKSYVNKTYSTNEKDILYGASNSGLFVVYAMLESPQSFDDYIASSPMIGHCPKYMIKKLENFESNKELKQKHLYIHYGMKDHFKQVTEYLPEYIRSIKNKLSEHLIFDSKELLEEGHVPYGGIIEGMSFVYMN